MGLNMWEEITKDVTNLPNNLATAIEQFDVVIANIKR